MVEEIKHKTIPFEETIDVKNILGEKVLTNDGKRIGKVKAVHIHPTKLTVEGIYVDTGMFDVNQYIDNNYIKSLGIDGAILKTTPVTEYLGLKVFDSLGKKIGKVSDISRSNKTNSLLSITVHLNNGENAIIKSDYISAIGDSVMLKEPFEE